MKNLAAIRREESFWPEDFRARIFHGGFGRKPSDWENGIYRKSERRFGVDLWKLNL